jgi:hypothetical protein
MPGLLGLCCVAGLSRGSHSGAFHLLAVEAGAGRERVVLTWLYLI